VAFDEARFGLINWHRRRYCPKGFRPPYIVRRSYKWTYLYAALEPTTGESFCLYLPGMDARCLQSFLDQLSEAYPQNHLLVVLDGAPSHRSEEIVCPENVEFLRLPAYSPELDPVERWFQEFRRESCPTRSSRLSSYCKRHSAEHSDLTGKTPLVSNGSPVSPGGWRPLMRCDINSPDRYEKSP
jgi:transposase